MGKRSLILTLIGVAFTAISLLVFFIFYHFPTNLSDIGKDTVRFEIIKSLLQLIVIAIIGGVITYLFKLQEENRKQEQIKEDIRIDYFKRLGSIYRSVKRVRRVLRAEDLVSGNTPKFLTEIQVDLYLGQLDKINNAQLELEGLKIEASGMSAFAGLYKIYRSLKTMEKYLRELLKEYERFSPLLKSNFKVEFSNFERLKEFTGSTDETHSFTVNPERVYRFKADFADQYASVIKTLGEVSLK